MKKVAVVSCYFQHNYGSMLQAYATQKFLDLCGIPNETIRIDGISLEIHTAKMKYFRSRMFSKDVIKDKLGFVKLSVMKKLNRELKRNTNIRHRKFDEFSKMHFRLSESFSSKKELTEKSGRYSAFLVGSDQLWLPSNIAADYYTLNFVPDHIRKISYATSFGIQDLPLQQAEMARKFLLRINYLSVREKSGVRLVKKLTGLDAALVCDPTLLLTRSDWAKSIPDRRLIQDPYIFCYFLGSNQLSRACADKLRKKTGYKIVALQQIDMYVKSDFSFADIAPYDVDPADFVNLIRHAEYICTDSFHGTVFSVIHQKPFFSFRRFVKKNEMSTNNRIDSLLCILGLESRIINNKNEFRNALNEEIPYQLAEEKLDLFRARSRAFLDDAIKDLEEHNDKN